MPYVNVDEDLPDHRKVLSLPRQDRPAAMWLWMRGMCYSSRHLTDGFIPAGLADSDEDERLAGLLCEAGLWHKNPAGWEIHDFLEWNRSKEQVEAIKESKREAGRRGGVAKAKHNASKRLAGAIAEPQQTPSEIYPDTTTDTETDIKTSPLSLDGIPESVLGYWQDKVGREPTKADLRSLRSLCKNYPPGVVMTAIGQAKAQGEPPDRFALITSIAKAESRH
jgi:hypothetical protein